MAASQYVKETSPGQWQGVFTGHVYDHRNIAAAETLERREVHRQEALSQPSPEAEIERLVAPGSSLTQRETAARLRAHIESAMLSNGEAATADASRDELNVCIMEMFPEVLDTEYNGAQIRNCLDLQGVPSPWSRDHYASAITHLRQRGLLQVDQKIVNSRKRAEIKAMADQQRQPVFNEEEAYALPLNELERRARGSQIL